MPKSFACIAVSSSLFSVHNTQLYTITLLDIIYIYNKLIFINIFIKKMKYIKTILQETTR